MEICLGRPHECLVTLKPSLNTLLYIYQITYLFISSFTITHSHALGRHMDCLMTLACLLSPEKFPAMASTHYKEIIDAFFWARNDFWNDSLAPLHDLKMNDKAFQKTLAKKLVLKYWFTKIDLNPSAWRCHCYTEHSINIAMLTSWLQMGGDIFIIIIPD